MALTQFDFYLVSRREILTAFGEIPSAIPSMFVSADDDVDWSEDHEWPSYLDFSPLEASVIDFVRSILPEMDSWSDEAMMFGAEDGNKIELWNDTIRVRIDMRQNNQEFVGALVQLAVLLGCIIVCAEGGVVIEPNETSLRLAMQHSGAEAFVKNPIAYFERRAREAEGL